MRRLAPTITVMLALCVHAHAQPGDFRDRDAGFIGKDVAVLEIDDCPSNRDVDADRLRKIGSEHFQRGEVLYVQGDYKGAVRELVAAYCIAPFYIILKDIGQAYERELDYEKAIAYLERYVMEMPKDAKKGGPCDAEPADERRNVIARIKVLQSLRAKILINTDPPDAQITLSNDAGVHGRGKSGQELEVTGGRYQVLIEAKGFEPVTQEVKAQIGKPYTLFTKLEPRKGRVRIRVVPANARLFLDQRQIGTGAWESEMPGGRYTIAAEASGYITETREVEVLADRDTPVSIEMTPRPQTGRRQFIAYATVAGGVAGGSLAGATNEAGAVLVGAGLGVAGGFFGSYFIAPDDIRLGTSSLTITSSLIGGTLGGFSTVLFTGDATRIAPAVGGGLLLGGVAGYYFGERLDVTPGQAAVINTGALWGTVIGSLFSGSFEATAERRIGAGLVLSGLGIGTLGGVLMSRYFKVSRTRAALIDLGGLVGVFVGAAIDNVVSQSTDASGADAERTANYSLGGLAAGLILAGILTRNMDTPKISVTPVVSKTQGGGPSTTTFGLGGEF